MSTHQEPLIQELSMTLNPMITYLMQSKLHCPRHLFQYKSYSEVLKSIQNTRSMAKLSFAYTRTVTNVGEANSSYDSVIVALPGVNVTLNSTRLKFSKVNQKMTYQVAFSWVVTNGYASFIHGFLMWKSSNSIQFVGTPIFVKLV
ncbi:hypothetical protein ACSBR2_041016 [Camellia fascicularis]